MDAVGLTVRGATDVAAPFDYLSAGVPLAGVAATVDPFDENIKVRVLEDLEAVVPLTELPGYYDCADSARNMAQRVQHVVAHHDRPQVRARPTPRARSFFRGGDEPIELKFLAGRGGEQKLNFTLELRHARFRVLYLLGAGAYSAGVFLVAPEDGVAAHQDDDEVASAVGKYARWVGARLTDCRRREGGGRDALGDAAGTLRTQVPDAGNGMGVCHGPPPARAAAARDPQQHLPRGLGARLQRRGASGPAAGRARVAQAHRVRYPLLCTARA